MEIIFSHFTEDKSKSKLERAIAQLPKNTFVGDGKCLVTLSPWRDGDIVKFRLDKKDISSTIKLPEDANIIEKKLDLLYFNYQGIRYLAFYVNF